MKVLITTYWYDPTVNGVVTSVMNLRRSLEEAGHEVRVLTMQQKRKGQTEGVYMTPSKSFEVAYPEARVPLPVSRIIYEDIQRWNPDVVHSQCEIFTLKPSIKIARKLNVLLIHTYHTDFEEYTGYFSPNKRFGKFLSKILTRYWLKHIDTVIVPTIKMKRMIAGYGITKPIAIIPTGIDLSRFENENTAADKLRLRKELGLAEDAFILLYFGRLAKEKNIAELIAYMRDVKEDPVILLIAGFGPESDALIAQAEKQGLQSRVHFKVGRFEKEDVPKYYQAADVFVSASKSETQGLTYVEALASGLPVLCRKDECLEELVIDDKNGYQYETEEEFLSFLQKIVQNTQKMTELSSTSKISAKEYSLERFAQRVVEVYQNEKKK